MCQTSTADETCVVDSIKINPSELELQIEEEHDVAVSMFCDNGDPAAGCEVNAKI